MNIKYYVLWEYKCYIYQLQIGGAMNCIWIN